MRLVTITIVFPRILINSRLSFVQLVLTLVVTRVSWLRTRLLARRTLARLLEMLLVCMRIFCSVSDFSMLISA